MEIRNPTGEEIDGITIEGIEYEIGPYETKEGIPEEHAKYWVGRLHKFLEIVDEGEEAEEISVQEAQAMVNEAAEDAGEEEEPVMETSEDPEELVEEYTRDQLDIKAEELGLEPDEYQNKAEISEAIIENRE